MIVPLVVTFMAIQWVDGFVPPPSSSFVSQNPSKSTPRLSMALTPVGLFCPFKSNATVAMDLRVTEANEAFEDAPLDGLKSINQQMRLGQRPDPDILRQFADNMEHAADQLEGIFTRMHMGANFQTREYAKLMEEIMNSRGGNNPRLSASMMRWESEKMRAEADGTPPPKMPQEVAESLFEQLQQEREQRSRDGGSNAAFLEYLKQERKGMSSKGGDSKAPSLSEMQETERITVEPFEPDALKSSPEIQLEYKKLVRDHSNLIDLGAKYGEFDPGEKIAFLDQIEAIEDRWDAFFFRFKLMNKINEEYLRQCEACLAGIDLTEVKYRDLLKKSHRLMRQEAEMERDRL